jgi:hypothetical protein
MQDAAIFMLGFGLPAIQFIAAATAWEYVLGAHDENV